MRAILPLLAACLVTSSAAAEDRVVGPGQRYATIGDALSDAVTGDVVVVSAGTYAEALSTQQAGVTIRAATGEEVIVQVSGRVLDVQHDDTTIESLIIDGDYGDRSPVRVQANSFMLRDSEVRRSTRDCVALGDVSNITVEGSLIHRCLNSMAPNCSELSCRDDAHGIGGSAVRNVRVIGTEIHTFSGDAIQLDPSRDDTGWSGLEVEGCRFWLAPLASAEGGYAAGVVPGENAIDTKTSDSVTEPAIVTVRNTVAYGFRGGLIDNMSVYNIKENVNATFDGVHVYDSEIAFRLSGPGSRPRGAEVLIANAVIYDVDVGVRQEDDIEVVRMYGSTFGRDVGRAFHQDSSAPDAVIDGRNLLFLAGAVPDEAAGGMANSAVDESVFVDAASDDYHLAEGSSPIDMGVDLPEVTSDRDGNARPMGGGHDVGAYEWCPADMCAPPVDAGRPRPDGGPVPDSGPRPDGGGSDTGGSDGGSVPAAMDDGGCCSTVGRRSPGSALAACMLLSALLVTRLRRRARRR